MIRRYLVNFIALFSSVGTLLCCAVPSLLVLLGSGSTVVSLFTNFPSLEWLAKQKVFLFTFSALMLILSYYLNFIKFKDCSIEKGKNCREIKSKNIVIFYISVLLYLIGFFMSFIAGKIFY